MGETPETHFGHKNVILRGLARRRDPGAPDLGAAPTTRWAARACCGPRAWRRRRWRCRRHSRTPTSCGGSAAWRQVPFCAQGVDTRELPRDCHEQRRRRPSALFEKLAQWGGEALVIPHGLAWGIHAPPGATPRRAARAPRAARRSCSACVEVYSGHGNSRGASSAPRRRRTRRSSRARAPRRRRTSCPAAGRRARSCASAAATLPSAECEARVAEARRFALEAGSSPHWVLPDARRRGLARLRPAARRRLQARARAAAARERAVRARVLRSGRARRGRAARRFRWGFVALERHAHRARRQRLQAAASQGHDRRARPRGGWDRRAPRALRRRHARTIPRARSRRRRPRRRASASLLDVERGACFLYPGGLVAVHAAAATATRSGTR